MGLSVASDKSGTENPGNKLLANGILHAILANSFILKAFEHHKPFFYFTAIAKLEETVTMNHELDQLCTERPGERPLITVAMKS